jgi:type VI secretion system secreted protein VgrG
MPEYSQAERMLEVQTPLGEDVLLLIGLTGREAISELFCFRLDLLAEERREVPFEGLLGQAATVRLGLIGGENRYFHGILRRVGQGMRDGPFIHYSAELVPELWLLTKRVQSRVFQHLSVIDILRQVLSGLKVSFQVQGAFPERNYCVQYQESDFAFASRLMEEEGIFYFFQHTADGHTLVLANTPQAHPPVPCQSQVIYDEVSGGVRPDMRIHRWQKFQEVRAGRYTLWDHSFELPGQALAAQKAVLDQVTVGQVAHPLAAGGAERLEVYEYPGGYARWFDGIDAGGGERPANVQQIFAENQRTVAIRMQQEAAQTLQIDGGSDCGQFTSGHRFTLVRHFNGDGDYVLTAVEHEARLSGDYRSGQNLEAMYENRFTAMPLALPYRPPRVTPRPAMPGAQTAVVVGPAGEEIFTDKYGRVKVQFAWDRQGKKDADSSCWLRVATSWAGKGWGAVHIPRIGQEVLVDFLDGDPDRPIIIGSLFNAETMPPLQLPAQKTMSGIRSSSTPGGNGANEIIMDDAAQKQKIEIHAQKDMQTQVLRDQTERIGILRNTDVRGDDTLEVGNNQTITDLTELTEVKGDQSIAISKSQKSLVGEFQFAKIEGDDSLTAQSINLIGAAITLEAGGSSIKLGGGSVVLKAGTITLEAPMIVKTGGTIKKGG